MLPVNGVAAAGQDPWEHPSMVAQREKAVSYAAERAVAKQRQNIRVLRIGLFMLFAVGAVLMTVGQFVARMQQGMTVAALAAFVLGVCLMLTTDYDVNEYMLRHQRLHHLLIIQVLFLNTIIWVGRFWGSASTRASTEATWAGSLACTPHYLWVLWRQNEIRKQPEGRAFPLATELVGLHFVLFYSGRLVQFIVVTDDLGQVLNAITIGMLVLGVWLMVWISLARSRWGVVGGARRQRWLAMAAAGTTPTQRAFLSMGAAVAIWMLIVSLGMILPAAGEARTITVPVLYMLL